MASFFLTAMLGKGVCSVGVNKIGPRIGALVLFVFFLSTLLAVYAQNLLFKPDARVWTGEVRVVRKGSGQKSKDEGSASRRHVLRSEKEASDEVTIKACGQVFGSLYVQEAGRTYRERSSREETLADASTPCEHSVARPGWSSQAKEQLSMEPYSGEGSVPFKEAVSVLLSQTGQGYRLIVTYGSLVSLINDEYTEEHHVCEGATKITESHQRTSKVGAQGTASVSETGQGDGKHWSMNSTQPPFPLPGGFTAEGPLAGDVISGSKLLSEIKPNQNPDNYQEKTTAEWNFTGKDPCPDVYDQLLQDLALAQAYVDQKIQDAAGSLQDYEKRVDERAGQLYAVAARGSSKRSSGEDTTDMQFNPDKCEEIEGKDAFKEKVAAQCLPAVIFEAVLAHEEVHQSQCKTFSAEMKSGNPHVKGLMETTAYLRGAQVLLDWLKEHCPAIDTSKEEQTLDKIRKIKASRTSAILSLPPSL